MKIQYFRWYVMRPETTILSYPSTQQITNLINCGVAIGVTPTYNTTNTPNKIFFKNLHTMSRTIKLLKLPYFSAVLLSTQLLLVLFQVIQIINLFQSQYFLLYILLPYFIIKIYYEMHIIYAWFNFQCKIQKRF